jgi:hypothetical protein
VTTGKRLFTEDQEKLLAAVLNRIIPAEGQLPAAGDLGIAHFIEGVVSKETRLRRLFTEGMASIAIVANQEAGGEFQSLPDSGKDVVLQAVESQYPTFFGELVRQGYNGYYTNPKIFDLIGYTLPDPQGYQPKPFDESLLEPQRRREPFWRQV